MWIINYYCGLLTCVALLLSLAGWHGPRMLRQRTLGGRPIKEMDEASVEKCKFLCWLNYFIRWKSGNEFTFEEFLKEFQDLALRSLNIL